MFNRIEANGRFTAIRIWSSPGHAYQVRGCRENLKPATSTKLFGSFACLKFRLFLEYLYGHIVSAFRQPLDRWRRCGETANVPPASRLEQ